MLKVTNTLQGTLLYSCTKTENADMVTNSEFLVYCYSDTHPVKTLSTVFIGCKEHNPFVRLALSILAYFYII